MNKHVAVCDESSVVTPDDFLSKDLLMSDSRRIQYSLSDRNQAKHRWYYCFPKMQMEEVLLFE